MAARTLSYSEVSTALSCFARWDFSYGGYILGGDTLRERATKAILSDGRAWGSAVALLHAGHGVKAAMDAAYDSLCDDARQSRDRGFHVAPAKLIEQVELLEALVIHYEATAGRLPGLTRMEDELNVPILSPSGKSSSRFRFQGFIDGHTVEDDLPAVVEFKLRKQLTPLDIVEKMLQYKMYAWGYRQELRRSTGEDWNVPFRIIVDERLKEVPAPARVVKAKRKGEGIDGKVPSHSPAQVTDVKSYVDLCKEYDVEPVAETVFELGQRKWQIRHRLTYTPDELDDAGQTLSTAATIIGKLDRGQYHPIRNGSPWNCRGCRFKGICSDPSPFAVDALFERTTPKRLKDTDQHARHAVADEAAGSDGGGSE